MKSIKWKGKCPSTEVAVKEEDTIAIVEVESIHDGEFSIKENMVVVSSCRTNNQLNRLWVYQRYWLGIRSLAVGVVRLKNGCFDPFWLATSGLKVIRIESLNLKTFSTLLVNKKVRVSWLPDQKVGYKLHTSG
jgi:hypothetical protein